MDTKRGAGPAAQTGANPPLPLPDARPGVGAADAKRRGPQVYARVWSHGDRSQ